MVARRKWGGLWAGSRLALLCAAAVAAPSAAADQGRQRPQSESEIIAPASDSPTAKWDTYSDTWVATDALNRQLPAHGEVGAPRNDRFVGLFFFLWHGAHVNATWGGPYDISRILAQDREALHKPTNPLWGPIGAPHHWGESLFGYYLSDDAYVLRKQAQMLADAGVDTLIFDVSNQNTYKPYYMALLRVFAEVRQLGGATPQVAFLTPFSEPAKVVAELYRDLYEPGLYQDLWFKWVDKPLILADPILVGEAQVNDRQDTATPLGAGHTLGQLFIAKASFDAVGGRFPTFATQNSEMTLSLYRDGPQGERLAQQRFKNVGDNDWLSIPFETSIPAGKYYLEMSEPRGTIGWWSHKQDVFPDGQAFSDRSAGSGDRTLRISLANGQGHRLRRFFTFRKPQPDYFRGQTGANMWSWLEVYPQHVFRDSQGVKEQMSISVAQNTVDSRLGAMSEPGAKGRSFHKGVQSSEPDATLHGYNVAEQWERALQEDPKFIFITGWNEYFAGRLDKFPGVGQPVIFVDAFDQEHSRDIEPMKGGHGDLYYYQMASYIRKFKGVREPPLPSPPTTIQIDGDFRDWAAVQPEFRDDIGDVIHRDHPGYNNFKRYVNQTGRNDFVVLKMARDQDHLYFYARTAKPITPSRDSQWMMLFLDTDAERKTGWEGYDFVVNRTADRHQETALLEENRQGWNWKPKAQVRYQVRDNELEIAIRRADLGLENSDTPLRLDFKWADNTQIDGDITAFTLNGDSAPNGRFNYRYSPKPE
jgi:hypothetical protein